ncbi:hypothetical protein [Fulvivirga ligni]|uniref:hypothetical protein n=1 Tax=Fulvivirga ligni TaxID=2904246 RepID=UPI001F231161|nr:hypothetical protein [Fulvivirga ligni]UII18985.1 hypothetical protein LVD16_14165 [Fulvivirga ligni]
MNQLLQSLTQPLRLVTYSYVVLLLFTGCKDSNNEEPNQDDNEFESLNNLQSDTKFTELISLWLSYSDQVTDNVTVYQLLEKQDALTEREQLELAHALGFDSVAAMYEAEQELWDLWIEVVARFGLLDQDDEAVSLIFVNAIKGLLSENNSQGRAYDDEREKFCQEQLYNCTNRAFRRHLDATGARCKFCMPLNYPRICVYCDPAFLGYSHDLMITSLLGCRFQYDCCIIGYDSNECQLMS